ncbi:MAG: hypothetical protein JSR82_25135 [Verrucomicrobia bacterium]|nr:hypothetical protein [Verrucomicrobiota bacterium]
MLITVIGAVAAGCCVVPPYGWGHGPRGRGYYQEQPTGPQFRGGDDHRRYPNGPSRY